MTDYSLLTKEALLAKMEDLYARAKPHQDFLVDNTVEILACSSEVYRRLMVKIIPDARYTHTRVLTRISCTKNALGEPALELARRLHKFAEEGIRVTRVEFDETLSEFTIHADPENKSTPSKQ